MNNSLHDLRTADRYIVVSPLTGSFGSAGVTVLDICEHGVQIEHAQPLRIGTRSRLWFRRGETATSNQAIVVWSRLSKTPNEEGKLLYHPKVVKEFNRALSEHQRKVAAGKIRWGKQIVESPGLQLHTHEHNEFHLHQDAPRKPSDHE